jgi:hypothetical protein
MIPPAPCTDEQLYITANPLNYGNLEKFTDTGRDARRCISGVSMVAAAFSGFHRKNCMVYFLDKLNACPEVHVYAVSLLKQNGWQENGRYWTRPGKNPGKGHSAVFSWFEPYGIYLFTNFSDKGLPFVPNKSYSDCMIIAILAYSSDYTKCISELMQLYSHLL